MGIFIITGILMTITVGIFIGLILTAGVENVVKRIIITALASLIVGFGIAGAFALERLGDESVWNEGYCECGCEWKLLNIQHIKNGGDNYYYACDDCGDSIMTHSKMK